MVELILLFASGFRKDIKVWFMVLIFYALIGVLGFVVARMYIEIKEKPQDWFAVSVRGVFLVLAIILSFKMGIVAWILEHLLFFVVIGILVRYIILKRTVIAKHGIKLKERFIAAKEKVDNWKEKRC